MSQGPLINYAPAGPAKPVPWAAVWAGGIGVLLAVELAQVNRRISHGHTGDFRHFYYAARALLDGTDPYTSGTGGYLYPPLIALLYTPVARLSYTAAQRVMLVVDLALVVGGLLLAGRAVLDRFDAPRRASVLVGVVLLAWLFDVDKVHNEIQMFQTNALQLALFALSLFWLDRRPRWAGVPLGAILNIKYLSLALVPWLLVRRRWATAASTLASGVGFAVLPAAVCGWHRNLHYLRVAYGGLATMVGHGAGTAGPVEQANVEDITSLLSCSLTSAMARMAKFHGLPLAVGLAAALAVAAVVVGVVLLVYARRGVPAFDWPSPSRQLAQPFRAVVGIEFVAVLMGTLMFSPQTNSRHLILATLLTTLAAALLAAARPEVPRGPLAAAVAVMFLAFVLPPGNRYTNAHHWADLWFGIGGPCWGLLVLVMAVVDAGLLHATLLAGPPATPVEVPPGLPVLV